MGCCGNTSSGRYEASLKQVPINEKEVVIKTDYKMNDGALFTGQMKHVKDDSFVKHGKGKQTWIDGASFDGEWRNGVASGVGHFQHANTDVYVGEFTNDKANGFGKYSHGSGQTYEGHWVDDLQDGSGTEILEDGSKYVGCFKNGKKNGLGSYKWNDKSSYSGEWVNNNI